MSTSGPGAARSSDVSVATDVCALPLVRRLAAMLDRDPLALREGDPLPHGWHPILFNPPTRQSALREDGAADLGVPLPDLGLPRLMLGGRRNRFAGEIPIGATLRRETHRGDVQLKEGRSGRFALVEVVRRIFVEGQRDAVVVEYQDYVLRPASVGPSAAAASTTAAAVSAAATPLSTTAQAPAAPSDIAPIATIARTLLPDEPLLFRYSAITDNPHRIHYDLPYATTQEGYSALVVNGSIPAMFLLEMFRQHRRREPIRFDSRNLAPMLCGQPLTLRLLDEGTHCRLRAEGPGRRIAFEARAD